MITMMFVSQLVARGQYDHHMGHVCDLKCRLNTQLLSFFGIASEINIMVWASGVGMLRTGLIYISSAIRYYAYNLAFREHSNGNVAVIRVEMNEVAAMETTVSLAVWKEAAS